VVYDLTWLNYLPKERRLIRTVLVLESEWKWEQKEIDWDFHKLLVAKADLRVMVFQVPNLAAWQKAVERLNSLVCACEQSLPGDHYLLAGWIADVRRFKHCDYVYDPG